LARFNSQHSEAPKNFVGLPCPAAAAMISTTVLFCNDIGITRPMTHISILLLVYLLSYLMVSTHPYSSFKQRLAKRTKTFQLLVSFLLLFILVAAKPEVMLFVIFLGYIVSGPLMAIFKHLKKPVQSGASETPPKHPVK